ncbi:MAG: Na+/H+ antiporter NhaA [Ignavibacteriae bacterium]|nr:MAG: Na+/H+ antiporter NhaA [Ignavibacteriota bacterium]
MNKQISRFIRKFFRQVVQPIQDFIQLESSAGFILMGCTVIAFVLANSPLHNLYQGLWQTEISIGIEGALLTKTLFHWINDGLMCIFFFVVGLEIKREILIGELASIKRAILPVAAALGGMIIPAFIYFLFTKGTGTEAGWGIPMATDIAFSLGVLALLGSRIPHQLKVLLTAFAIIDDLGAVLVIALFYGSQIQWLFIAAAAVVLFILFCANRAGIRRPSVYVILGMLLWFMMLESGIHATIAGVLLALTVPARPQFASKDFVEKLSALLQRFMKEDESSQRNILTQDQQSIVQTIGHTCQEAETPLLRFEHTLHPWVTFAIMPIFALANAGVMLGDNFGSTLMTPAALGILCGLVIGKQIGITLFAWISVKLKLAELPSSITWKQIYGIGLLGGIGFTMSLFIANLAFHDENLLNISKTAILLASFISGCLGMLALRVVSSGNHIDGHNA